MNKIFKKTITSLLAGLMVMSSAVYAEGFKDMPEDDTRIALENAVKNGLLTGYDTGEIKPYDNITRAQMAAIIVRAMGAETEADISMFKDMDESQWYYDEMSKAVAMEAFKGDGENLNPEDNITFQEAFAVIARIFDLQSSRDIDEILLKFKEIDEIPEYEGSALDEYSDNSEVAKWAFPTTLAIVENGYWNPEDKMLRPTEYINRAEFATLMDNIVKVYIDEPGKYAEVGEGNVLIRSNDVYIDNVVGEKTDIFVGDGVSGDVTTGENVNINRLVQRGGKVKAGGNFVQLRMIGHGCFIDISEATVSLTVFGKHSDSEISVGTKDVG